MNIEKRLKRLEQANVVLFLLLAITVLALRWTANDHVVAAEQHTDISAKSIETHSLEVVNSTGKQGVKIAVGDDGMVSIEMTDVNGDESIGLLSDPSGKPSICLAFKNVCRVVMGDVYRGDQRELSVQLRNGAGKPVWMPAPQNPLGVAKHGSSAK